MSLAGLFNIDPMNLEKIEESYALTTAAESELWLSNSTIIHESNDVKSRAETRAFKNLAPSHRAKNAVADCVVLESYASFVEECRFMNLSTQCKVMVVSSNTRDFTRSGKIHPDISATLEPLGIGFATSMLEARNELFKEPKRFSS